MPSDITVLYLFETDKELKQHPSYVAAKAGDVGSALGLVSDLALATIYGATARFTKEDIFVAPHAKEATGDNAIPQVFAEVCALVYEASTDTDIVQSTRVYHTGADPMERLVSRPQFEGAVKPGGRYVLVDDVTSLGGTLAELAHYIQANGGLVQDFLCWSMLDGKRRWFQTEWFSKNWQRGTQMTSVKSLASQSERSLAMKRSTLSASVQLTNSEIESLRQGKKSISAYVQREFQATVLPKLELLRKQAA